MTHVIEWLVNQTLTVHCSINRLRIISSFVDDANQDAKLGRTEKYCIGNALIVTGSDAATSLRWTNSSQKVDIINTAVI